MMAVLGVLLTDTVQGQVLRIDLDDAPYVDVSIDCNGPCDELDTRGDKPFRDPANNCAILPCPPGKNCHGDAAGQAPWPTDGLLNVGGEIPPEWLIAYPSWINIFNVQQFHYEIHRDTLIKTQGAASMRIETTDEPDSLDSAGIEDIYLARQFPTVAGADYAVTFDLRLSDMRHPDPNPFGIGLPNDPWIMYAVLPDGSLDANDIVDIEDRQNPSDAEFPCFVRPDTIRIPPENVDEQWHTYVIPFTAEATAATFVLYIRNWWTPDDLVQPNYLDNIVIERLPLFASAAIRDTAQTVGCPIDASTYQGVRFHLDETTQVTEIGGHLESSGTLFGAIVPLSGPSAMPGGPPFDPFDVPLVVTLSPGSPSTDIRVPYEVVLPAGDYAVIFGSGAHGATGTGAMPTNNVELGAPTYIEWNGSQWIDSTATGKRFIVDGETLFTVPATSTSGFLLLAATMVLAGAILLVGRRESVTNRATSY